VIKPSNTQFGPTVVPQFDENQDTPQQPICHALARIICGLVGPGVGAGRVVQRVGNLPGLGVWTDQHAENLLAGPQLHGLDHSRDGQLGVGEGVPHESHKAPQVRPCVELVLASQQVGRRQKVLQKRRW